MPAMSPQNGFLQGYNMKRKNKEEDLSQISQKLDNQVAMIKQKIKFHEKFNENKYNKKKISKYKIKEEQKEPDIHQPLDLAIIGTKIELPKINT